MFVVVDKVALWQAFLMLSHISIISQFSVIIFHPSTIDTVKLYCQKCSPESFIMWPTYILIFINFYCPSFEHESRHAFGVLKTFLPGSDMSAHSTSFLYLWTWGLLWLLFSTSISKREEGIEVKVCCQRSIRLTYY